MVAGVDHLTGGDYLYLASPPPTFSLLNVLGPWPWYIGSMIVLGVAVLVVLDLTLRPARSRAPESGRAPATGLPMPAVLGRRRPVA